jgi:hypothetical protein
MSSYYHWSDDAECREESPDMFLDPGWPDLVIQTFCNNCPVKQQCLSTAMHSDLYGIWGGTTRKERVKSRQYYIAILMKKGFW